MNEQPPGLDLKSAYKVFIQVYIRNHSLCEGQRVQFFCNKEWLDATVTAIGPGPWDNRMVQILSGDGSAMEVHCKEIRVPA